MKKELIIFQNKYGAMLHLIVAHYISIGERQAASLTEKELADIRARLEAEEKAAEKEGKILLMTADFQCCILEGCRELALLSHNDDLVHDVNLLIAQHLVPESDYLKEVSFSNLQNEYWSQVISQYVESWANDEEREEFETLLEEDGMEEVINEIINDDYVWGFIDEAIEYGISHLK